MENDPKLPVSKENKEPETRSSDAAAMSERLLALTGDSDEYSYAEPPVYPAVPVVPPKVKRRGRLMTATGAVILFVLGGYVGSRLEKRRMSPPVAVVNGEAISQEEFAHASEISSGRAALQHLIDDRLILQFAKKKGVTPDQQSIEAKYNEDTKLPDFFKRLKLANQTPEDFKHGLLILMCRQAIVSNGQKVNPSEVKAWYDKNTDRTSLTSRFYHPESVQIEVIVTKNEDTIRSAQADLDAKMPFQTAVAKWSTDVSKAHAGVLPVIKKGTINAHKFPGLDKILFDMQVGNQTAPIQMEGNWWIIKCLNHEQEKIDPYEKVQDECTTGLLYEKGLAKSGPQLKKEEDEFMKASTIDIKNQQYSDVSPKH